MLMRCDELGRSWLTRSLFHPARARVRMAAVQVAPRQAPSVAGSRASSSRSRATAASSSTGLREKSQRGALITSSLPTVQNLVKRSPESYAEEFAVQWARFGSLVKIVQLGLGAGKADEEQLREVTGFVCQVRRCHNKLEKLLN